MHDPMEQPQFIPPTMLRHSLCSVPAGAAMLILVLDKMARANRKAMMTLVRLTHIGTI